MCVSASSTKILKLCSVCSDLFDKVDLFADFRMDLLDVRLCSQHYRSYSSIASTDRQETNKMYLMRVFISR